MSIVRNDLELILFQQFGRQIMPIRSTTRGPAGDFTSRKLAAVAKGIVTQRQTEKPELRKSYQNPSQKQETKQLGQRPHPGRKNADQIVTKRLAKPQGSFTLSFRSKKEWCVSFQRFYPQITQLIANSKQGNLICEICG
jgi:hypothetical protein